MTTGRLNLPQRLCAALALAWIVPGIAVTVSATGLSLGNRDQTFVIAFTGTSLLLGASFWLWWRLIQWTFSRVLGSAATTAAVLAHLFLWQPLWNAGCVTVDVLRMGQCGVATGVWVGVTAYVWWGLIEAGSQWRKSSMSANAVRIVWGLALVPFVPGLWTIVMLALEQFVWRVDWVNGMIAHALCASLIVGWWLFVWRPAARRTAEVWQRTLAWSAGYVAIVTLCPLLLLLNDPDWMVALWVCVPLMLTGLWLVLTAWMWRIGETPLTPVSADVQETLKCLSCGYSLIGLHEARCPDCGRQSTLDELFGELLAAAREV